MQQESTKDRERMIKMWRSDCQLSQEHLWPEGLSLR